jgi:hypothetical protein
MRREHLKKQKEEERKKLKEERENYKIAMWYIKSWSN